MMSILNKVSQMTQTVLDKVTGAEQPKMYYDKQGQIKDVLKQLPQLQQKYRT